MICAIAQRSAFQGLCWWRLTERCRPRMMLRDATPQRNSVDWRATRSKIVQFSRNTLENTRIPTERFIDRTNKKRRQLLMTVRRWLWRLARSFSAMTDAITSCESLGDLPGKIDRR